MKGAAVGIGWEWDGMKWDGLGWDRYFTYIYIHICIHRYVYGMLLLGYEVVRRERFGTFGIFMFPL